jgi:hypothetical protein
VEVFAVVVMDAASDALFVAMLEDNCPVVTANDALLPLTVEFVVVIEDARD